MCVLFSEVNAANIRAVWLSSDQLVSGLFRWLQKLNELKKFIRFSKAAADDLFCRISFNRHIF